MLINGIIHNDQLWVKLKLAGYHGSKEIYFLIDTGFDGELSLPVSLAIPLGLALVGESEYKIAGGTSYNPLKFVASIQWGSQNKLASVDVDKGDTPLLGMRLLTNYTLFVNFKTKSLVIEEPKAEEPQEIKGSEGETKK
ncbi:MAG: hypothetical protein PHZ04_04410 [Patescibacteria group bacterium]|nr:hypothetical protein [Patescibacteria group bacterium]MDD5554847.1 hypothetical protein [Patescibacteria group bacterium]